MNKFMLSITASSGEFYQGDCEDLTLPISDGIYGVQAGHNPVLVALHMGILHFVVDGKARDVLGGRALVGKHCHIGAGAVLAGVIEPASAEPVRIDDDVLVGANAVVIEGVHVGKGAVVAAGAVVTKDVEPYTVVAGMPAKKIKDVNQQTIDKTKLEDDLRG